MSEKVIVTKAGLQKILELYKELDTLANTINKEHASATSSEKKDLLYSKLRHNNLWDRVTIVDEFTIDVEYNTPRAELTKGGLDTIIFTISTEFDTAEVFTEFETYFDSSADNFDLPLQHVKDVLNNSSDNEFVTLYE